MNCLTFQSCRISFFGIIGALMTRDSALFLRIEGDAGAGLLLFAIGIGLWTFGLSRAGDAKLIMRIGLPAPTSAS
ncbi:hypothetical protein NXC14_CH00808 [Rhizobium sp. NXC14]|nr:hypothetical protein NXC14_CH00808 [Rhizobium sp. NXC14]